MIPKKTFLFVLLSLSLSSIAARANDTLLYRSSFEERLFENALKGADVDFIALYSAINSDSTTYEEYASTLKHFYTSLDRKLALARSDKQKAKLIFKEVHAYFFSKYEEN